MVQQSTINPSEITDKARRDLLRLLESVRAWRLPIDSCVPLTAVQIRGKKNLVIQKALAGTVGLFVKYSTLQEYGVDRVFFLENDNIDSSLRNVVFLVRSDKPHVVRAVAGQKLPCHLVAC